MFPLSRYSGAFGGSYKQKRQEKLQEYLRTVTKAAGGDPPLELRVFLGVVSYAATEKGTESSISADSIDAANTPSSPPCFLLPFKQCLPAPKA